MEVSRRPAISARENLLRRSRASLLRSFTIKDFWIWRPERCAAGPRRSQHPPGLLAWNMASGMRGAHLHTLLAVLTLLLTLCADAGAQGNFNGFTGFNLNPPYFNLAEGASVSASATCGQDERGAPRLDLYCKLVGGASTGVTTENIQVKTQTTIKSAVNK